MPAPWLLAAAWVWLALAVFAACAWDRFRHRLPAPVRAQMARVAGLALVPALALAAWGWWQPASGVAADLVSALLWQGLAIGVSGFTIAAAACLLGGSIYLAFGRLMGSRACSACGWQAMIVERLPEVAAATAVAAIGMTVFQGSVGTVDRAWVTGSLLIQRLGFVWWLVFYYRSVLMVRQPAFWRTAFLWFILLQVGRIVWRFLHDPVTGDPVAAGWRAGGACGVALVVLAAALHRQAILLGLRFDRPAALAEIVGGLSPLRRLAACAVGGLLVAGVCGGRLLFLHHHEASSPMPGLLVVAVAILWLLVTWGAALVRDRLGPACSPSISTGTLTLVVGLASIGMATGRRFEPDASATGITVFLSSVALVSVGVGWCGVIAGRHRHPAG